MKKVAIVQARMTSTRLPGKILMDLAGRPMLAQVLSRVRRSRELDDIVVATTVNGTDDPVVALAKACDVRWFRGSEEDVLARYTMAAREANADVVIRITADCPLIDPGEVDRVVRSLVEPPPVCDYAANIVRRTFPRGLDAEAFFRDTLERVDRMAVSRPAREHVTQFILAEHPELFALRSVTAAADNSDLRWTVDLPEDLAMVRLLYESLHLDERELDFPAILAHVRAHPEIARLNRQAAS